MIHTNPRHTTIRFMANSPLVFKRDFKTTTGFPEGGVRHAPINSSNNPTSDEEPLLGFE